MQNQKINKSLQYLVDNNANKKEFTLSNNLFSSFIAGDYLYVVPKNEFKFLKEEHSRVVEKKVSYHGNGILFKKIVSSQNIREGFVINEKHNYPIVSKNNVTSIEANADTLIVFYNNSYYKKLNLTGSMVQELLSQYNKSENQEMLHCNK